MRGELEGSFSSYEDCFQRLKEDAWSWGPELVHSGPERAKIRTYATFFMDYSMGRARGSEISGALFNLERGIYALLKGRAVTLALRPGSVTKEEFDPLLRPLLEAIEAEMRNFGDEEQELSDEEPD